MKKWLSVMPLILAVALPVLAQDEPPSSSTSKATTQDDAHASKPERTHDDIGAKHGTANEATMNKEGLAPDPMDRGKVIELEDSDDEEASAAGNE